MPDKKKKGELSQAQFDTLRDVVANVLDEMMDVMHDDPIFRNKVTARILLSSGFQKKLVERLTEEHSKNK